MTCEASIANRVDAANKNEEVENGCVELPDNDIAPRI